MSVCVCVFMSVSVSAVGAHAAVECEVVVAKCAPFEAPEHGSVSPDGEVAVGECVDIVCDDHYQLVPGSPSRGDV